MKKKLFVFISLVLILVILISSASLSASAIRFDCDVEYSAKAILVANLQTDTIVYNKNSAAFRYATALSELVNFIIVTQNVEDIEKTKVDIKQEVIDKIEESDKTLNSYIGKSLTVEDLLYIMMLTEGKDASYVLADYITKGKVDDFVKMMNKKAKELGCKKTNFVSCMPVVDSNHKTSCEDLYKIMNSCITIDSFNEISSSSTYIVGKKSTGKTYTTNNSIKKPTSPYRFSYIKQSKYAKYHSETGGNIVSIGEYNGNQYMIIALGCKNGAEKNAFTDTKEMFTWACLNLQNKKILDNASPVSTLMVDTPFGTKKVDLVIKDPVYKTVPNVFSEMDIDIEYDIPELATLPIFKGQNLGTGTILYRLEKLDDFNLTSNNSVGVSAVDDIVSVLGNMYERIMPPIKTEEDDKNDNDSKKTKDSNLWAN